VPRPSTIDSWLERAVTDAAARGIPELEPLLRGLAQSTAALRAADWNDSVETRWQASLPGDGR
jgi:hypothetical protein